LARSIVGRKLTFVGVGVGVGFGVDLEVMVEMVDLDVEYELEILVLVLGMLVEGELLQRGPIQVTVYVIWPSPWRATRSFAGACGSDQYLLRELEDTVRTARHPADRVPTRRTALLNNILRIAVVGNTRNKNLSRLGERDSHTFMYFAITIRTQTS
jgi:hypothetical protein